MFRVVQSFCFFSRRIYIPRIFCEIMIKCHVGYFQKWQKMETSDPSETSATKRIVDNNVMLGSKPGIDKDSNISIHNRASTGMYLAMFWRSLLLPSSGLQRPKETLRISKEPRTKLCFDHINIEYTDRKFLLLQWYLFTNGHDVISEDNGREFQVINGR